MMLDVEKPMQKRAGRQTLALTLTGCVGSLGMLATYPIKTEVGSQTSNNCNKTNKETVR